MEKDKKYYIESMKGSFKGYFLFLDRSGENYVFRMLDNTKKYMYKFDLIRFIEIYDYEN